MKLKKLLISSVVNRSNGMQVLISSADGVCRYGEDEKSEDAPISSVLIKKLLIFLI